MKIAYFDCFSGISGNMILGALVDLGVDIAELKAKLDRLDMKGWSVKAAKVAKQGISATYVDVVTRGGEDGGTLDDITRIIEQSDLDEWVKARARQIFGRLAKAEAKIHRHDCDGNTGHLHEVGDTDTIIDVVGGLIALRMLGIDEVRSSPLNLGSGMVRCRHGLLPVPAPVTAELLRGVPVYSTDTMGELTTPTGAAMIMGMAAQFGPMPVLAMEGVGYGAGKMDLSVPNVLRVFVGQTTEEVKDRVTEPITLLETNIDDMNPQLYDHIMEKLLETGALDVFLTPVQMKKNRPGTVLSVVARREEVERLLDIILSESTTLGVRVVEMQRRSLLRSSRIIKTGYGRIRVKVAKRSQAASTMIPEYDDCKKAAKRYDVPISQIYAEVQRAISEQDRS